MYKVFFSKESSEYILNYFDKYREYYENLYEDSWIWSENQIIKSYIDESLNRHNNLKDLIIKSLKDENILWRNKDNSIIIKWRTKYIFIDFQENNDLSRRYISNISIR
jgi:hypothetical protein